MTITTMSIDEVAATLRKSRRWLQDWLARHPVDASGHPFCSQVGRTKLFRESDVARIMDAMMVTPRRPSSFAQTTTAARPQRSASLTSEATWAAAEKLIGKPLPRRS